MYTPKVIASTTFVLITILAHFSSSALVYIPNLPVPKITLVKAQVALNRWLQILEKTYCTREESSAKIKAATELVYNQLKELSKELEGYDNVLMGSNNAVMGNKNIIVGNGNKVRGSKNYIFSQNFNSKNIQGGSIKKQISNILVADQWIGQLDRIDAILQLLHTVIYPQD